MSLATNAPAVSTPRLSTQLDLKDRGRTIRKVQCHDVPHVFDEKAYDRLADPAPGPVQGFEHWAARVAKTTSASPHACKFWRKHIA